MLFLHGWGGSKDSFLWVKNHIAQDCSMIFVSFKGFGLSRELTNPYKLVDYVEDLKGITFQKGMGSMFDKTNRIVKLAEKLAMKLNYIY